MNLHKARNLALNVSIPISKAISVFHRPECQIVSADEMDMRSRLRNGDVFVTKTDWELSNPFIPTVFKHCGVYFDGWVYESTTHNTRRVTLGEFIYKKDHIGIVRKTVPLSGFQLALGLSFMEENLGEPYDYGFSLSGSSAWYCSKFVRTFFIAADPSFEHTFVLRTIFGEPTIKPDDYWFAKDMFTRIAAYNTELITP